MSDKIFRARINRLARLHPELSPHLSLVLAAAEDDSGPSPEARLQAALKPLGKDKRGFWLPPHNMAINFALMGINLWKFTILPYFWNQPNQGYREDLKAIIINPRWESLKHDNIGIQDSSGFRHLTDSIVNVLLDYIKKFPSVEADVKKDLERLERHFHITIPAGIKSKLAGEALKVANRRWGVKSRLKSKVVPLDGSKPYDLSDW